MTVHSQNGWPAFHTPGEGHFVRFTVGGRGFWAANADVAVVAGEYLTRFNAEVERLIIPGEVYDDWSFADRLVRGSTATVSNHGSATAWDANSTRHPLGVKGTFSAAKLATMRRIKDAITDDAGRPVLRLGIDYSTRVDAMHVEINADSARVKQAANKIRTRRKDDDMPTVTEIVAALRPVIQAEARAAVVDALKNEPLVPNRPTRAQLAEDPKAGAPLFTLASALANVETDDDNDRNQGRLDLARVEGKLDQLLRLAGPATGK